MQKFDGFDFMLFDERLTDEERMVRDTVRSFVEEEALPKFIYARLIRFQTDGRNEQITIITTLLDRERYPTEAIAELYGFRWNCELNIRSIKSVMGMDELRCKTPAMLRRSSKWLFRRISG